MRLAGTVAASKLALVAAWGSSSSSTSPAIYYPNEQNNWLFDSATIAMKVEGCVWATTDDNEDVGCMQDASGDGTTYWYQMAMCRRAQVAYSVYATSSSSATCNSNTFKGTVSMKNTTIPAVVLILVSLLFEAEAYSPCPSSPPTPTPL
jgi:hypothetical protein